MEALLEGEALRLFSANSPMLNFRSIVCVPEWHHSCTPSCSVSTHIRRLVRLAVALTMAMIAAF